MYKQQWVGYFFLFIISNISIAQDYLMPPNISIEQQQKFKQWQAYNSNKITTKQRHSKQPTLLYLNELIKSQSPYLLQHAYNPVNWKPWGEGVREQAKKENKLIFLSIGYSTCHWCHVMAKESFSDKEVAQSINKNYIAIKVDREELPYIDDYYASALKHLKGSAGWPITAIITSEGLPVFIDSYLSKNKLLNLLSKVSTAWNQQPEFLLAGAKNIAEFNQQYNDPVTYNQKNDRFVITEALNAMNKKLLTQLDPLNGGFKGDVKFPSESLLMYSLDQLNRGPNKPLEKLVKIQLDNMIRFGLYDHVGDGFFRYSTDSTWSIPHFEKMLYTQAQLIMVYIKAYEFFNDPVYRSIAIKTTNSMIKVFYEPSKGFYSAVDADYKGQEGEYYFWDKSTFNKGLKKPGFINLQSINNQSKVFITSPQYLNADDSRNKQTFLTKLLSIRNDKEPPHKDHKILTSWNGLVIKALVQTEKLLENGQYISIAEIIAEKLWQNRFDLTNKKLTRTSYKTQKDDTLYLDDYAYYADALLELYDYSLNEQWFKRAEILQETALELFLDDDFGLFNSSNHQQALALKRTADEELFPAAAVLLMVENKINHLNNRQSMNEKSTNTKLMNKRLNEHGKSTFKFLSSKLIDSPLEHLYTAKILNEQLYGSTNLKRFFASSKGNIKFKCTLLSDNDCYKMDLIIKLEPGWHINSREPLQEYLIATTIKPIENISVSYPSAKKVKLGFQKEPLSVYEGEFIIKINKKAAIQRKLYLQLPIQACNDRICLLPETLKFIM